MWELKAHLFPFIAQVLPYIRKWEIEVCFCSSHVFLPLLKLVLFATHVGI